MSVLLPLWMKNSPLGLPADTAVVITPRIAAVPMLFALASVPASKPPLVSVSTSAAELKVTLIAALLSVSEFTVWPRLFTRPLPVRRTLLVLAAAARDGAVIEVVSWRIPTAGS